jgi:hypothetical protein
MNRILPIVACLLVAACEKPESPAVAKSEKADAAPAAPAEIPLLEGNWRVTMIDGQDAASLGMTAAMVGGKASLSTGCLRRAWTYTQNRNLVAFTASPGESNNCGKSPSGTEEAAYAAINDANMAIFGKDGKEVSLSGTGGMLTLQRR